MTTTRALTFLVLSTSLAGCNGAFLGNLVVLAMTVGIFFGTLSLGRSRAEATRSTDQPTAGSSTASQG